MTIIGLPNPDARDDESKTQYSCIWWNHPQSVYAKAKFVEEALLPGNP
jgi:hypothetical protein